MLLFLVGDLGRGGSGHDLRRSGGKVVWRARAAALGLAVGGNPVNGFG